MSDNQDCDIQVKVFHDGKALNSSNMIREFIEQQEMRQDQILAITACEKELELSDSLVAIFYRTQSLEDEATPYEKIKFIHFDNTQSWEQQVDLAELKMNEAAHDHDIFALCHSPKNIGHLNNQMMFFGQGKSHNSQYWTTSWEVQGDKWDQFEDDVHEWLNKHIAPHQLISVSMFEDEHPCDNKTLRCVITHTAGSDEPQPLENYGVAPVEGGIYKMTKIRGSKEPEFKEAAAVMRDFGIADNHTVSLANDSSDESYRLVVFSWSTLTHTNIEALMRPVGCCTIF